MTETKYLPHDWLDEYCPTPQADPNAFISGDPEIGYWLMPVAGDEERELITYHIAIAPGDVIAFDCHRHYGDFSLTVYADGEWSTPQPIPQDANCFTIDHDDDTLSGTIPDLIENNDLAPEIHFMTCWHWSSSRTMFRFEVKDGRASLVQIGGTQ